MSNVKAQVELDAYMSNPYVNVIKHLVETSREHKWSGTATELRDKVSEYMGHPMTETVESVGKIITKYKKLMRTDGIFHDYKKSNTRTHTFVRT